MTLAKYLDPIAFSKYPCEEYLQDRDIIVNSTGNGTLGRIGIFRDKDRINGSVIVPDSHVTVIRFVPSENINYLLYILKYYQPFLEKLGEGSTNQTELKPAIISELLFPIPPIREQHRIADKLIEIFPLIDAYNEKQIILISLQRNFSNLFKKSILQMAVQGKLVPQDPNDEPASVLLERILAEKEQLIKDGKIKKDKHESIIFRRDNSHYELVDGIEHCIDDEIPFELPESWCWVRLGSLLTKLTDGTHNTPKYVDKGIPFLSVKDLSLGKLDFLKCKYISEKEHSSIFGRCNPEYGDVLLTKVGTTGIPVIVDTEVEFSLFVSVALLKFNQKKLFNKFLLYQINSSLVQGQALENTKGVGNKNWVMRDIARTLLVLPPIIEQHRIVAKIEELLPLIQSI